MLTLLNLAAVPCRAGSTNCNGGRARYRQFDILRDFDRQALEHQREVARRIGISLALILRLVLLGTIAFIVKLTTPLFSFMSQGFSWRDLILIAGGLFLVWKATKEIYHRIDPNPGPDLFNRQDVTLGFAAAMSQIIVLDLVFSIDSIITAVGMTDHIPLMVIAVVVAVIVVLVAATPLANFVD